MGLPQVGEILVERTVAEVVPAVKGNKEQLDTVSYLLSSDWSPGRLLACICLPCSLLLEIQQLL